MTSEGGIRTIHYDFHLTRSDFWKESQKKPIGIGEWQQVVKNDKEMKLVNAVELKTLTGEVIKLENEGLSLWKNPENGDLTYFTYRNGRISVKSPSDGKLQYQILCKMKQLAKRLQANVQGNDGEFY